MTGITIVLGGLLTVLGALCLYAAAPAQKMLPAPAGWRGAVLGGTGLGAALGVLMAAMGPAGAIYTAVTVAMTVWSLAPLALAFRRRKEAAR
ncbi:hypothetical protein L2U69_03955 [Zavarzinia compransoris]|uniref:hypothetical protein n=1 Tax=Zavarzinia marina TaxID=2911065 RepID=UPI001F3B4252|nr:hypothetical protein [Zavarzinia marina]MCF4164792.1 hypothetical protein [Zavarzinia marina]